MTLMTCIDLGVGDRFGRWVVVGKPFKGKKGYKKVRVKCDCGTTRDVDTYNLQTERTTSCGSCNAIQLGDIFGRLTVVELFTEQGRRKARVRCDCGTEKIVVASALQCGDTRSCGCIRKELTSQAKTTHGMADSRLYCIWSGMVRRCTNPKEPAFERYGAKGIRVHDEWRDSFEAFQEWAESAGYRDDLTIDRIDGRKSYSPENCRFTTRAVQNQNRRKQRNNQSGFIGVHLDKNSGRYRAQASISRRGIDLGYFSTPIEAARVRDAYVKKHYESPMLNFPEEGMKA